MKFYLITLAAYLTGWVIINFMIFPFLINTKKRVTRVRKEWAAAIVEEMRKL